jgi:hypothetical protein
MKIKSLALLAVISLCALNMGMARNAQYDEEARMAEQEAKRMEKSAEKSKNPLRNIASGVKQATVDSTTGLISDTAHGGSGKNPVVIDNIQGAREGSGRALDNAVKGAYKVATLGFDEAETVKVREPEKNTDETTKFSIAIPGT